MSPASTAPNGWCLYPYLPNGQANMVRYDNWLSNLILWYPKLALMIDIYCTLLSFGSISLSFGPLCISLINAWLSCTGSKYSCTIPFAFGTTTKLLHHSAILPTPRGVMMSSSCSCFGSSLKGFCNAYAMCLGGAWYGLLSGLSCNKMCL